MEKETKTKKAEPVRKMIRKKKAPVRSQHNFFTNLINFPFFQDYGLNQFSLDSEG